MEQLKNDYIRFCEENEINIDQGYINVIEKRTSLLMIDKNCNIEESLIGASFILRCHLPNLMQLKLESVCLTLENLSTLTWGLSNNKFISELFISSCNIQDEGAIALSAWLQENQTICELSLPNNNITDIGSNILCNCLQNHPSLKMIDFSSNKMKTDFYSHIFLETSMLDSLNLSYNLFDFDAVESMLQGAKRSKSIQILKMKGIPVGSINRLLVIQLIEKSRSLKILHIDVDFEETENSSEVKTQIEQLNHFNLFYKLFLPSFLKPNKLFYQWNKMELALRNNYSLREISTKKMDIERNLVVQESLKANCILEEIKDEKSFSQLQVKAKHMVKGHLRDFLLEKIERIQCQIFEQSQNNYKQLDNTNTPSINQNISMIQSLSETGESNQIKRELSDQYFERDSKNEGSQQISNVKGESAEEEEEEEQEIHLTEELVQESKRYKERYHWKKNIKDSVDSHKYHLSSSKDGQRQSIPQNIINSSFNYDNSSIKLFHTNNSSTLHSELQGMKPIEKVYYNPRQSNSNYQENKDKMYCDQTLKESKAYPTFQTNGSTNDKICNSMNLFPDSLISETRLENVVKKIHQYYEGSFSQIFQVLDKQQASIDLLSHQVAELHEAHHRKNQELKEYQELNEEKIFSKIKAFRGRMDKVKTSLKHKKPDCETVSTNLSRSGFSSENTTIAISALREIPAKQSNRYQNNDRCDYENNSIQERLESTSSIGNKQNAYFEKENIGSHGNQNILAFNSAIKQRNISQGFKKKSAIFIEHQGDNSNSTSICPNDEGVLKLKDLNLSQSSSKSFSSTKAMQSTHQTNKSLCSSLQQSLIRNGYNISQQVVMNTDKNEQQQQGKNENGNESENENKRNLSEIKRQRKNNKDNQILSKSILNYNSSLKNKKNSSLFYDDKENISQFHTSNPPLLVFQSSGLKGGNQLSQKNELGRPSEELLEELRRRGVMIP